MAEFRPKYITFDCYGTLIHFHMSDMTRTLFAARLDPDRLAFSEMSATMLYARPCII
jgi:2-haloacid dehalogenase